MSTRTQRLNVVLHSPPPHTHTHITTTRNWLCTPCTWTPAWLHCARFAAGELYVFGMHVHCVPVHLRSVQRLLVEVPASRHGGALRPVCAAGPRRVGGAASGAAQPGRRLWARPVRVGSRHQHARPVPGGQVSLFLELSLSLSPSLSSSLSVSLFVSIFVSLSLPPPSTSSMASSAGSTCGVSFPLGRSCVKYGPRLTCSLIVCHCSPTVSPQRRLVVCGDTCHQWTLQWSTCVSPHSSCAVAPPILLAGAWSGTCIACCHPH